MFQKEPAIIIGALVLAANALAGALITDEGIRTAVTGIVTALGALLTRHFVYSPATVAAMQ